MNWDRVQGNWKQVSGKVKEQWGKLTDDEITQINGNRDQLEGKLQGMPLVRHALCSARDEAPIRSGCHNLERRQHYVWT